MKKTAFTLAEVLITLTIIGVIAALTIPNLMQKWSDHADVAKVKEAYSILSNAMKLAVAENGPMDGWDWPVISASEHFHDNRLYMAQVMQKYFKVANFCGISNGKGSCSYNYAYTETGANDGPFMRGVSGIKYNVPGMRLNYLGRIQLANGMLIGFNIENIDSEKLIFVDINGEKKPNRAGYDCFLFSFDFNGKVSPGYYTNKKGEYCNGVTAGFRDGSSCAEYVIKHSSMDYKHLDAAAVNAKW